MAALFTSHHFVVAWNMAEHDAWRGFAALLRRHTDLAVGTNGWNAVHSVEFESFCRLAEDDFAWYTLSCFGLRKGCRLVSLLLRSLLCSALLRLAT